MQGRCRRRKLALFGLAILPLLIFASADDAAAGAEAVASAAAQKNDDGENAGQGDTDDSAENSTGGISEDDMDSNPEDESGYFYDPMNEFCVEYDCYKILGYDYETFGRSPPDTKMITKSFRLLSRKWHPDKNKSDPKAEERFVVSCLLLCVIFA